jgi:hypothetical protein
MSTILWNVDTLGATDTLMIFEDTLNKPTGLSGPEDGADSGRQSEVMLSWKAMNGADFYEVQYDEDPSFKLVPESETVELTSLRITGLESGRSYYWRVRTEIGEPILSPWSEGWEFTTAMGAAQWNPFVGGVPEAPYNGATNVPIRPTFAWNAADWATGYEFELSTGPAITADGYFTDALIGKTGANALTNTVWQSEQDLDRSTTYYWHVRAISKTTKSEWASAVFSTEAAPPAPPPPPPPPVVPEEVTPFYIWVIIGVGALLVIAVIILIVRTRARV